MASVRHIIGYHEMMWFGFGTTVNNKYAISIQWLVAPVV